MDIKTARAKYHAQKKMAATRGIGWQLTFQEWLDWWGEDLDRRGSGVDNLQMQRVADSGPYKLGNIRKGTPKQNSKTCWAVQATKRTIRLAKDLERARDEDPGDSPGPDEWIDPEEMSISEYFAQGGNDAVIRRNKSDVISGY